jgi:DNA-binding transcriptional ArsR family regulator
LSFNYPVEYHVAHVMVNKMVDNQVLDRTYAALSDPTRRALLVALRKGDARISDLAAPMPMSFAAVARHVGVLEHAGLIRREVRGREHWMSVRPNAMREAERWINEQNAFWSRRADALAARLERKKARK